MPQENLFALPTPEGVKVSPGVGGGANWSPVSIDTKNGVVYVAAMHQPTTYRTAELPAADGKPAVRYIVLDTATTEKWGTLTAIDLAAKGKILWQNKTKDPLVGGVLATAGGLVFNGEGNGDFAAFDAKTGEKLWRFAAAPASTRHRSPTRSTASNMSRSRPAAVRSGASAKAAR